MEKKSIINFRYIFIICIFICLIPCAVFLFNLMDFNSMFDKFIIIIVLISIFLVFLYIIMLTLTSPIVYRFDNNHVLIYHITKFMNPIKILYLDIENLYYSENDSYQQTYHIMIDSKYAKIRTYLTPNSVLKTFKNRIPRDKISCITTKQFGELERHNKIISRNVPRIANKREEKTSKYIKDYKKFYKSTLIIGIFLMIIGGTGWLISQLNEGDLYYFLFMISISVFLVGDILFTISLVKLVTRNRRIIPSLEDIKNQYRWGRKEEKWEENDMVKHLGERITLLILLLFLFILFFGIFSYNETIIWAVVTSFCIFLTIPGMFAKEVPFRGSGKKKSTNPLFYWGWIIGLSLVTLLSLYLTVANLIMLLQ